MKYLMHVMAILLCASGQWAAAQGGSSIGLRVVDTRNQPLTDATVVLQRTRDSAIVKLQVCDNVGAVRFSNLASDDYLLRISHSGYADEVIPHVFIPADYTLQVSPVIMKAVDGQMNAVTITARKPFVEMKAGKTVVNVESGISMAGTTALEALEKMPGITIDKDGNISFKGRSGVTVFIDGKPSFLDGAQLAELLNGMSASQISTVDIMDQPSAKYDAAGNAGIIDIHIKKNKQRGFHGSATVSVAQGVYPKNSNNLQLNYRSGAVNLFLSYNLNANENFTRIYALRRYFDDNGQLVSMLEQPSFFKGKGHAHNLRAGMDYAISKKTNAGISFSGMDLNRNGHTGNPARWLDANGGLDSMIQTDSRTASRWNNGGINLNLRHAFIADKELSMDVDRIVYRIRGNQFFENFLVMPGSYYEASRAALPSDINIRSAKVDYSQPVGKGKLETGAKTSHISTDNLAAYEFLDGSDWKEDAGKSNHFLYRENIHALYVNGQTKTERWNVQGGLRYEMTNYEARQLGNSVVKDSSFSRSYNSLFPSAGVQFRLDSANSFALSAGRRIDRPAFQKLNPFVFIINKYTYQTGNPFFRPQYTWNIGLSHSYKNILVTELNYSIGKDYFSQIFPVTNNGIIIYTEGNLDRLQTFGVSVSVQVSPTSWWSFSSQVNAVHKKMKGFIEKSYSESVTQANFNLNNQLRFSSGWSAELSGWFTSQERNDIQEVVDPAGQLSMGVAKSVLKNKATIKLAARDLFYTQWMKGNTHFTGATEYFKLTRDTRVVNLSISYRFGKPFKNARASQGSAKEEMERVSNG